MRVQVAAQVAQLDELRQLAVPRRLELAAVLAQLRRDEVVAEEAVQLLLGARGERLAGLGVLHAVLGDGELAPHGGLAQRDVVVLRAGEVLEQVAVALGRHDAQVEAVAVVRDDRRLRRPLRRDVHDPAQLREVVDQRGRVVRRRDDVEVAHGLPVAARAARDRDLVAGRMLGQHRDDRLQRPAARGRAACASAPRPRPAAQERAARSPRSSRPCPAARAAAAPLPPRAVRRAS